MIVVDESYVFSIVLHKMLKGLRGVRLDNRKVLHALGPGISYSVCLF